MESSEIGTMAEHYARAALWTSYDEHEIPLDKEHTTDDIDSSVGGNIFADCKAFFVANAGDLEDMTAEQAGHDFLLTRNHHGAGFWCRGLGECGDRLTKSAESFGEMDFYVGVDGKVYCSNGPE